MSEQLSTADHAHVWHPFTSLKESEPPLLIDSAKGMYLHTADGKKILDAVSSWWVNIHGHSNEYIAEALYKQALKLEHVIFAGFTHEPAIRLAQRLVSILPGQQQKIFFSDNGSTAVEVAIKMALQYWHNQGIPRKKIIAIRGAYHGDTFGAMSVGERSNFTKPFFPFLFDVDFIDFPIYEKESSTLKQFSSLIEAGTTAAFIYEPLLQGSAGMRTYRPEILQELLALAKKHEVICIADEVLTGFGRTGKLFASEHLSLYPDIVALSKGLTGGTLPLGITACNSRIENAFQSEDKNNTFYHGHSFTANPIACACAHASLDLLLQSACMENITRIGRAHQGFADKIRDRQEIISVHQLGTLLSLELQTGEQTSYFNNSRNYLYHFFLDRGILMRPLGNVIYILPPYIIKDEELKGIYAAILDLMDDLNKRSGV